MRYLCIDTSAGASVALVDGPDTPLGRAGTDDTRAHAEQLTALIEDAVGQAGHARIADAGITHVVVGTGPAPFTGLRAGLVSARVIAWTLGVPLLGVCSLDVLARQILDLLDPAATCLVATDARRREVYAGRYRALGASDVAREWGPEVASPDEVARTVRPGEHVGGPGAHLYRQVLEPSVGARVSIDAAVLARIAAARARAGIDMSDTAPLYLRRPDVHVPTR